MSGKSKTVMFTTGTILGLVFLVILVILLGAFWGGWLLMLLFGILHSVWAAVPAIGYWTAVPLAFVGSLVLSALGLSSR